MTCNETGEFVSALCDGGTIPREAAEHIGSCSTCQVLLTEYLAMGAELCRIASLTTPETVRPLDLNKKRGAFRGFWGIARENMRIPRFAFAALLVGIAALSVSLALVKVRARSEGNAVLLKIATGQDLQITNGLAPPALCALSTVDKNDKCGLFNVVHGGVLAYKIELLAKDSDRIRLGVSAKFVPLRTDANGTTFHWNIPVDDDTNIPTALDRVPEKQYWFEPGQPLPIEVAGFGTMVVTGEWLDHKPSLLASNGIPDLDPGPNELRMISPLLLRDEKELFDFEGFTLIANDKSPVVEIYVQRAGLFELSLAPLTGAVEGDIALNRINFKIDGGSYSFLTGAPVARSGHVWVLHDKHYKPPTISPGEDASMSTSSLEDMPFKGPAKN